MYSAREIWLLGVEKYSSGNLEEVPKIISAGEKSKSSSMADLKSNKIHPRLEHHSFGFHWALQKLLVLDGTFRPINPLAFGL